jgi:hypothetical protein
LVNGVCPVNGKWTVEEDAKLTEAATAFGIDRYSNHWVGVAVLVPGRTNVQCNKGWVETLHPGINSGKWMREEDAKLTGAVQVKF